MGRGKEEGGIQLSTQTCARRERDTAYRPNIRTGLKFRVDHVSPENRVNLQVG